MVKWKADLIWEILSTTYFRMYYMSSPHLKPNYMEDNTSWEADSRPADQETLRPLLNSRVIV
jgi:hypothetical protein